MQDVVDILEDEEAIINVILSARQYCELMHRRLTLNLERYRQRQKAQQTLKKEQSEASYIIAYAQEFHLPVETETLTILAEATKT